VQLEVGNKPTPFEHRSIGEELALCQRYFERKTFNQQFGFVSLGANATSTIQRAEFNFAVEKRNVPSISHSGANTFRINGFGNDDQCGDISVSGEQTQTHVTALNFERAVGTHVQRESGFINVQTSFSSAFIEFDAEL